MRTVKPSTRNAGEQGPTWRRRETKTGLGSSRSFACLNDWRGLTRETLRRMVILDIHPPPHAVVSPEDTAQRALCNRVGQHRATTPARTEMQWSLPHPLLATRAIVQSCSCWRAPDRRAYFFWCTLTTAYRGGIAALTARTEPTEILTHLVSTSIPIAERAALAISPSESSH